MAKQSFFIKILIRILILIILGAITAAAIFLFKK